MLLMKYSAKFKKELNLNVHRVSLGASKKKI